MAFDSSGLDSYNDVPSRIAEFRAKHPEGSLQPVSIAEPFTVREIGGQLFIVYVAAAYRTPDDPRPGIGTAYEPFPGRTPYTKASELQNAETSAWGRAIVAALAADTRKGVASALEVRNRQAERNEPDHQPAPVVVQTDTKWRDDITERIRALKDRATGNKMWGEINAKRNAGACAPADVDELRDLIVAYVEAAEAQADDVAPTEGQTTGSPQETKTNTPIEKKHAHMHALWREAGDFSDRDARIAYTKEIIGREITSSRELTGTEADTVIDRLRRYIQQNTPPDPDGAPADAASKPETVGASA